MKVLVIAPQPFFSPRGTPLSVYYRTLVMSELGVHVDLVTYGEGQDVIIPGVRIIRNPRFAALGNVKVGPSILKLFLDWFLFWRVVWLLLRNRYEIVHAHEEAIFMALILKPLFRYKLIYDMHSSLPQQLSNFRFSKSRVVVSILDKLEKLSLRKSDAVITICPALAEYAEGLMPDPRKQFLIENSIFDSVRLARSTVESEQEDRVLPEHTDLVFYAGTFEAYQGIDLLIRAFAKVNRRAPGTLLMLVGGTAKQVSAMRHLAMELRIDGRCHFTGRLATDSTRRLMRKASVLVSPRITGNNSPLKIYEQLASGIPLVATAVDSHTQVLSEDVCFLTPPDPGSFAIGIETALTNSELSQSKTQNARALYEQAYCREAYVEKLLLMLHSLEWSRETSADELEVSRDEPPMTRTIFDAEHQRPQVSVRDR